MLTNEEKKLQEGLVWRKWGPYLSERQWGTVREDYSPDGTAWEYLPHDHARSRAYRWGEEGIAGISDNKQLLCFSIALWNGKDPFLKERLFGLTGNQGNHGEDVKEYAFYLDNTPSHSYMKYLYKYPQQAYPYEHLLQENQRRTKLQPEYELLDTGIFDEDRYFDVFVEYAKADHDDLLIQITAHNRGPDTATLHLLPTLWFRNTWSWEMPAEKPELSMENSAIKAIHHELGTYYLHFDPPKEVLFTENETNQKKLFNAKNASAFVKDGINDYLVEGAKNSINPKDRGTKASPHYELVISAKKSATVKLRLSTKAPTGSFDALMTACKKEADDFYNRVSVAKLPEDMRNVQRQAFAGLLWNKQLYHFNVRKWLNGDPATIKPPEGRKTGRNHHWQHVDAYDIFSMPDKWEYPWFASWDLAFHTISLALIDPEFAKHQLLLLTREWYMHPNGQIPAYEWAFSDVNPPVHAWAAMRIYQIEHAVYGRKDRIFLEKIFQKLTLNFTWWVNQKDAGGLNIFEGGFLGLDNIGAFDRSKGSPVGGTLEQPDGTGWMGMYCLNLLQIALELSIDDPVYEDMATKFFEHFVTIADAINNISDGEGLWDEEEGFYYSLLNLTDGKKVKMIQDTLVGVVPLFAVAANDPKSGHKFPNYRACFDWLVSNRPELVMNAVGMDKFKDNGLVILSFTNPEKLKRILKKVLDEDQFLSPYGMRSVSKRLGQHPYAVSLGGKQYTINYEPAESTINLFGGNSNWRGPIWFPLNYLLIESLQKYHYYLGGDFKVEYPTGSGTEQTLWEVSAQISTRLINIFLKDENGRRPVYGNIEKFQTDPHWRDYIHFHEYFHGDNGSGLGASNQTGWTGLIAKLIQQHGQYVIEHKTPTEIIQMRIGNV